MKKANFIMSGMFFFLLSMGLNAQTQTGADYFSGKWNVVVKGTPNGDAAMVVMLESKDSVMTGAVLDTLGNETSKISNVDLTENAVTLYFNAQGYDITLSLNKKDDDHVTGSLFGMFDAEGERIKEN